jgi:hypothetical protein
LWKQNTKDYKTEGAFGRGESNPDLRHIVYSPYTTSEVFFTIGSVLEEYNLEGGFGCGESNPGLQLMSLLQSHVWLVCAVYYVWIIPHDWKAAIYIVLLGKGFVDARKKTPGETSSRMRGVEPRPSSFNFEGEKHNIIESWCAPYTTSEFRQFILG